MRGAKPLSKVKIQWSPNFAYAIGLITTDGNLSPDGRHMDFTSQDREQLLNFMKCLGIKVRIGYKPSGFSKKPVTHIQFGDVLLYKFLLEIGLTPRKSKTIGAIQIPRRYFFDFLRGHFDGDGTFYSYFDPRWRSSYMFYTTFTSASAKHILWLRNSIQRYLGISGHITHTGTTIFYQLKYAKKESLKLLKKLYYSKKITCLTRKYLKIKRALAIIGATL